MSDDWFEIHPRGAWAGLLRVHGSFGRTARMAAVAFLKGLLADLPPELADHPHGAISVHRPGWVGACGVFEVKLDGECVRFRRMWPKAGRWQLAAGWPPRRDPGPTCAELSRA